MYIGRDFKREIKLDRLKKIKEDLRPNRSWLDLFLLSLSDDFHNNKFDFTILADNLSEGEVIIIDSHDDIFKEYQFHYWRKDSISDILPAINCPYFKSETKIFKTSEMSKMKQFIKYQGHTKSIVIENTGDKLSLNLVYGDIIKITPDTFDEDQNTEFFDILQEKYELWEIEDCTCKPKKIRVEVNNFENLKYTIEELERISNTNDVKLGMYIGDKDYNKNFSNCYTMLFNHSDIWKI